MTVNQEDLLRPSVQIKILMMMMIIVRTVKTINVNLVKMEKN